MTHSMPTFLWVTLHIDKEDNRFHFEQNPHSMDKRFDIQMEDIHLDIRTYHNWKDLLNNPTDKIFDIETSMDMIDIRTRDNRSNQHDNRDDNLTNIEMFLDICLTELNENRFEFENENF